MNPFLSVLLSMLISFLRSTLKSKAAIKALVAIGPILVEARDLLSQIIDTIPVQVIARIQKQLAAGKTFVVKLPDSK